MITEIEKSKLNRILKKMNRVIDHNNTYLLNCLINHQKQLDKLTKQVNHLRINLVVRPDKIIKIPKVIK